MLIPLAQKLIPKTAASQKSDLTPDLKSAICELVEKRFGRPTSIDHNFINIKVDSSIIPKVVTAKKAKSRPNKSATAAEELKSEEVCASQREPNDWRNYVEQFPDYQPRQPSSQANIAPVHKYTIHIHRAMFTEELFDLYKRYEKAVHKKVREKANLKRFLCNSPLYDPPKERHIAESPMWFKQTKIDEHMHVF